MDECGEKNAISLSWGRREIRISGEGATLYVNGVPHDMTMMLETIRGAGARPERISPARWISLLRSRINRCVVVGDYDNIRYSLSRTALRTLSAPNVPIWKARATIASRL